MLLVDGEAAIGGVVDDRPDAVHPITVVTGSDAAEFGLPDGGAMEAVEMAEDPRRRPVRERRPESGQRAFAAVREWSAMMPGTGDEAVGILDEVGGPRDTDADPGRASMRDQEIRWIDCECGKCPFDVPGGDEVGVCRVARDRLAAWTAAGRIRLPHPIPLLAAIGMKRSADESDGDAAQAGGGSALMQLEVQSIPRCGFIIGPNLQQPAMVVMVAIDDMQRDRERSETPPPILFEDAGKESEVPDLDRRIDAMQLLRLSHRTVQKLKVSMAVAEQKEAHGSCFRNFGS